MPLQYKIEYRWDEKTGPGGGDLRKWRWRGGRTSGNNPRPQRPATADRKERATSGEADWRSGGGGAAGSRGGSDAGARTERGGKPSTSAAALEKVVLPAGYCVYYAPGRGVPLLHADPRQGRLIKAGNKSLGVVNPDSHHAVEEEYAIIREVMEIYMEKQVAEGEEGSRYRAGGQLKQQKQLLDQLVLSLSDNEGSSQTGPSEDNASPTEPAPRPGDTSRSVPATGRVSGRCLLPISKALRMSTSPRGPFFMQGQAVLDTCNDSGQGHKPREQLPETDDGQASGDFKDLPAEDDGVCDLPGSTVSDTPEDRFPEKSDDSSQKDPSIVARETMAQQKIKQMVQHPEANYGLIRNLTYRDLQNPRVGVPRRKKFYNSHTALHFIPRKEDPQLLVLSAKSPIQHRKKDAARDIAKEAQRNAARRSKDAYCVGKPIKGVFREAVKGQGMDGTLQQWRPVASYMQKSRNADGYQMVTKGETEGHSSVTRMPSKLVLDVVLPRESKIHKDGSDIRHLTIATSGPNQQALQLWMPSSSPPPPPPPSAPTNADGDSIGDAYFIHQDDGQDEDGDGPHSCSASYCSVASLSLSAAESLEGAGEPESAVHNGKGSSSRQSSAGSRHASLTVGEAADVNPASKQHSPPQLSSETTAASAKSSALPAARPHSARSVSRQGEDPGQTQTSCPRDLRCDVLGPDLCADCEAAQHRQQFTAQQDILYPHINATPRHMVASQKMMVRPGNKEDGPHTQDLSSGSWSHVSEGQLSNVVTDLELCKRVVERGHRAKLPNSFS